MRVDRTRDKEQRAAQKANWQRLEYLGVPVSNTQQNPDQHML